MADVVFYHSNWHVSEVYQSIWLYHKVVVVLRPNRLQFCVVLRLFALIKFDLGFAMVFGLLRHFVAGGSLGLLCLNGFPLNFMLKYFHNHILLICFINYSHLCLQL